ncbi:hypothetical protein HK101_005139, partial [Irineochytrium annulatum]
MPNPDYMPFDGPHFINDTKAVKPDDWDDDFYDDLYGGPWEQPSMVNPDWEAMDPSIKNPTIRNPNYIGPWVHPEIDNPDYGEAFIQQLRTRVMVDIVCKGKDAIIYRYKTAYVGFEIYQEKAGTVIDNIIVADSVEEAKSLAEETFFKYREGEKAACDVLRKDERKQYKDGIFKKVAEELDGYSEVKKEKIVKWPPIPDGTLPMFLYRAYKTISAGHVPKDADCINIGILGAANIAPVACITPCSHLANIRCHAVAARDRSKAAAFAKKHGIPVVHDSYEALLADPEIEAVFIPLPNTLHVEWAVKAIEAGKHVLCEKPLAGNAEGARKVKRAQEAVPRPLVVVEAFHWKAHPVAMFVRSVLRDQEPGWGVGKLESVESKVTIPGGFIFPADDIRFNYKLGGGSLMDCGCYAVSAVRFAVDESFPAEPQRVVVNTAVAQRLPADDRIDGRMTAEMTHEPSGVRSSITATLKSGLMEALEFSLTIRGSDATITVSNFIAPQVYHAIEIVRKNGSRHVKKMYEAEVRSTYYYQMKAFAEAVREKKSGAALREVGLTDTADAVKNMEALDAIYEAAGLPL